MREQELYDLWKAEESIAKIHGWDFSHLDGRWKDDAELPWDYADIVKSNLTREMRLLDMDTGGGEFLLKIGHPANMVSATEGYPPNVALCSEKLLPMGIDFRECADPANLPFETGSFESVINRHGSYEPAELRRVLKNDGLFITQQVGAENDRDLVELVLPGTPVPYPRARLDIMLAQLRENGFEPLRAEEAFRPIAFYDTGALVWFAKIIEWEFPGFSVDRCFDKLLEVQKTIDREDRITGTIHRILIVARKL